MVAFFPLLFLLGLAMPERPDVPLTDGMALTLLGTLWIGLALAHAICCASCRTAAAIVIDVLRRHVRRRHRRLPRRARVRHAAAGAADLAEQDRRGARVGDRRRHASPSGGTGLYQDWLGGWKRAPARRVVVGVAAPLGDLFESKIKRDAGTKDAGTLFGAHGGALDRLDAAFFTLVAGYYVWLALL